MHNYFDVFENASNANNKRRLSILIRHNAEMISELACLCMHDSKLEDKYNKFMMEFDRLIDIEMEYRKKFRAIDGGVRNEP
nr:MAG TPA: hypothetical protein [Caudoviricetes sp.]